MKKIEPGSYEDQLRMELSRKLGLLMDVSANSAGKPYTYKEIADAMLEQGINLSQPRWSYMVNGTGPLVTDPTLLKALADLFHVAPAYLIPGSDSPLPERIDAQLKTVRNMKHSKLKLIAARELGEVSPKTLDAINELLNANLDEQN